LVAVLFDLEGTLVDISFFKDSRTVQKFRQLAREKLIELGVPPEVLGETKAYTLMRNKAIDYVEANFSKEEIRLFHQKLDKFLERYEMSSAKSSKLYPDAISTLRGLKSLGYKLGLITNTSKKALRYMFSLHGLKGYFSVVVTREDVKRFKPEPEGMRIALKELGENEFMLVGDTVYDVSAAKKGGGLSIIVNRDFSRELDFQADHVVHSLEEVVSTIQALSKIKQE